MNLLGYLLVDQQDAFQVVVRIQVANCRRLTDVVELESSCEEIQLLQLYDKEILVQLAVVEEVADVCRQEMAKCWNRIEN